ncbi:MULTISPECIES: hypothetical protein [unclassified Streptomyces]|uniref:hypothetical protein n=1 Tax=unclassified Streptomyces TaxID=2593676 RepID=UPI00278C03C2|nr:MULTISPECIES: hypothetical protein [unclassified Streptomyces]
MPSSRVLLGVVALTAAAVAGCGTQSTPRAAATPPRPEASTVAKETPEVTAEESPSAEPDTGATLEVNETLVDQESRERARSAPSGDPVAPKDTHIPAPDEYGFGAAAATAQDGEVVAYIPRVTGGRLIVPLTIHNPGSGRVAYTINVRVTGGRSDADVTVPVKASNVFPSTTWPTEADVTAAGTQDAKNLKVTLRVTKKSLSFG